MLRKIIAIKNVGRYRNSATTPNPQLAKHTFIIGANSFGKSTLCAVLRSLRTGDPAHIVGRKTLGVADPIAVELLLESGAARFDGNAWSITHPSIAIFDGVFVAENVHSGEVVDLEHKRNLYRVIVGDDGVRLAEEEASLATTSRTMTSEITATTKAIQSHVPADMKLERFLALPAVEEIDDQIAEQERTVESNRQAAAIRDRAALSEIPLPALPAGFIDVLARTLDDIAQESEQLVASHLAAHGLAEGGGNWVAVGLDHADRGTCPFCGQGIEGLPLVAAYRAVFSDRYNALAADVASMKNEIARLFGEAVLGRLGTLAEQNKSATEFWGRYCAFDSAPLALPPDIATAVRALGEAAVALLDKKAGTPLEPVAVDDPFTTARDQHEAAAVASTRVNDAIRAVNVLIAAKKAATGAADTKAAEAELTRRKAIKIRNAEPVTTFVATLVDWIADKDDVDKRKEAARAQLDKHTNDVVAPYERRINELLVAFNAPFAITRTSHGYPGGVAASSYQLVINNTAVDLGDGRTPADRPSFKNTLSAGDRTTLALAFFLAHLERDAGIARKIVVFDDPFSSQDAFRRRQTVHEIIKVARRCAQVIVLSHDATFLKQVWDKTPAAERIALTIADHRAQGSKIMLVDLKGPVRAVPRLISTTCKPTSRPARERFST